jgi:DNA-binding transcriptional regulator YiaG
VECGRLVERLLPTRSMVCFDAAGVVAALNLPVAASAKQADREMAEAVDVVALRKTLGLTQEEMASAAGVSTRTLQNWETDGPSPAATRRLRDLSELARTLGDYMSTADIPKWLRSPNQTFRGSAPIALLAEGRTRDVLIEFRRMEMGEPG